VLADLIQVTVILGAQKDVDPHGESVDRSVVRTTTRMAFAPQLRLVRQERVFYFVGTFQREVIYSASASSMEQAWEKFRASPEGAVEVFCVIHTQTEIYLTQGA
jgi:hypothetical protein